MSTQSAPSTVFSPALHHRCDDIRSGLHAHSLWWERSGLESAPRASQAGKTARCCGQQQVDRPAGRRVDRGSARTTTRSRCGDVEGMFDEQCQRAGDERAADGRARGHRRHGKRHGSPAPASYPASDASRADSLGERGGASACSACAAATRPGRRSDRRARPRFPRCGRGPRGRPPPAAAREAPLDPPEMTDSGVRNSCTIDSVKASIGRSIRRHQWPLLSVLPRVERSARATRRPRASFAGS